MSWAIYPILKTREGRKRGEFSVGTVSIDGEGQAVVDCPDHTLAGRLRQHFSQILDVRIPCGSSASVLTYRWEELYPGQAGYVQEAIYRLHWLDLTAVKN